MWDILRAFVGWIGLFVGLLQSVIVVGAVSLFDIIFGALVLSMVVVAFWRGVKA